MTSTDRAQPSIDGKVTRDPETWPLPGRLLAALLAGLALPLTLAPFGWWWLGPLLVAAQAALLLAARSVREGALTSFAFGLGKFGLGVSWVYVSIHDYGHAPPWLAGLLVALFVAMLSSFHAVVGGAFVALFARARWRLPAFVGMWLTFDWLLTWIFTGFPWLLLGYGHLESPLAGYAPWLGVHGVTALVVATGIALLAMLRGLRGVWLPLALTLVWGGGALLRSIEFSVPTATQTVALVQGNIDQNIKWNPAFVMQTLETYTDLSEPHHDVDILLWPEAAVTLLYEQAGPFLAEMGQRMAAPGGGGALITGIVSWREDTGIRNLTVVAGNGAGLYTKRRLVPFGEYVPLEGLLRGLIGFFDLPMSRTEPGDEQQPLLTIGPARIAMAICYEVVYPELVRRQARAANLLATVSNDTWFGTSIGPQQHLEMARMRALELSREMLRATNNGVTAVIDSRGRVRDTLPQFTSGVLRTTVALREGLTPYARMGDLPVWLSTLALLLAGAPRLLARAAPPAR